MFETRTCSQKARKMAGKGEVKIKVKGKRLVRSRDRERRSNIMMERDQSKENE